MWTKLAVVCAVAIVSTLLPCAAAPGGEKGKAKPMNVSEAMRSQVIVLAECQAPAVTPTPGATAKYKVKRVFRCAVNPKVHKGDVIVVRSDFSKHPYFEAPPGRGTVELLFTNETRKNSAVFETISGATGRWPPNDGNIRLVELSLGILGGV